MTESNRPSVSYLGHYDVLAPLVDGRTFRTSWRVRTRLEGLLRRSQISARDYATACAFRNTWDRAEAGPSRSALASQGGAGGTGFSPTGSLDAARQIALIGGLLSPREAVLVLGCVILDVSWAELARHLAISETTASIHAGRAVKRLCFLIRTLEDAGS